MKLKLPLFKTRIFFFLFIVFSISAKAQCEFNISANPYNDRSCLYAVEEVVWTDLVGVTANANSIQKTSNNGWNADAISKNFIHKNGFVQTVIDEENTTRLIGLVKSNPDRSYKTLDFSFYIQNNKRLSIYEDGVNLGVKSIYDSGDTLRIAVLGSKVFYIHNNRVVYQSEKAANAPYFVDVAMYTTGSTLKDVMVGNSMDFSFTAHESFPGTSPTYQWMLNGVNVGVNSAIYSNNNLVAGDELECI